MVMKSLQGSRGYDRSIEGRAYGVCVCVERSR